MSACLSVTSTTSTDGLWPRSGRRIDVPDAVLASSTRRTRPTKTIR